MINSTRRCNVTNEPYSLWILRLKFYEKKSIRTSWFSHVFAAWELSRNWTTIWTARLVSPTGSTTEQTEQTESLENTRARTEHSWRLEIYMSMKLNCVVLKSFVIQWCKWLSLYDSIHLVMQLTDYLNPIPPQLIFTLFLKTLEASSKFTNILRASWDFLRFLKFL